ncbi:MAG: small multi-drug export protein [Bacilli bacterium]|nr:small multi-drug export protein [Bacilli bacterium]
MVESLVEFFLNIFSGITTTELGKNITIFIISLLPLIELRGGLIAAALLNVSFIKAFIICYIANILPIPFILLLIKAILDWMRKTKLFKGIVNWLDKKVEKKKGRIEKYGYYGVLLFVGIPLPGTGAWTGALIATMLNMEKKKTFLYIALGVLLAGIIMSILSYGVLKNII